MTTIDPTTSPEPDFDDEFDDDPAPTLTESAQNAQDVLGWTNFTDAGAMASAGITLARCVVAQARAIERLEAQVAELTAAKEA